MVDYAEQISGLGSDGYLRLQKESVYGTGVTNAMKDIKILPETLVKVTNNIIETLNQVNSRIKQDPNTAGRIAIEGSIEMDVDPTNLGYILDVALDQKAVTGTADTGYLHAFLAPYTGSNIPNSMTVQQALGGNLVDQFNGCTITGFELSSDTEKNEKMIYSLVGQTHTADVARVTSFTFGAVQPFSFGQTTITVTFTGLTAYTLKCNSFTFKSEFGYDTERYKLGSQSILQSVFKAIASGELSVNVDADATLLEYARAQTPCSILITTTHSVLAGAVSGAYSYIIEIPEARIKPETEVKNSNERLTQDIVFDIYGGTTTNSGTDVVAYEIRVKDAVASYA